MSDQASVQEQPAVKHVPHLALTLVAGGLLFALGYLIGESLTPEHALTARSIFQVVMFAPLFIGGFLLGVSSLKESNEFRRVATVFVSVLLLTMIPLGIVLGTYTVTPREHVTTTLQRNSAVIEPAPDGSSSR